MSSSHTLIVRYALPGVLAMVAGCNGASIPAPSATAPSVAANLPTSTSLAVAPNPAAAGAPVVLQATVVATSGVPTGSIAYFDGATPIGTVALYAGTSNLSISTLSPGVTHSLTAQYAGSAGFMASTSAATSLVSRPPAPALPVTATATFTFTTPNQTISGFGGSEAFFLGSLTAHPSRDQIYAALFDPVLGLGLTYLRVQNSYYLYDGTNAATFDQGTPLVLAAANAAHGTPLTVVMSSWSPPASLKSNGNVNNGGTLSSAGGGYNYAGFGQFWFDSLAAYSALDVIPAYISIQNEPDWTATYASCRFNPTEAPYNGASYASYGKAFDAVSSSIHALKTPPRMLGPETAGVANFQDLAAQIPASEVSAYAYHNYDYGFTPSDPNAGLFGLMQVSAVYPSALKFQTEYFASPGFTTAWEIHNALVYANDNAYFAWSLAAEGTIVNGQAADQGGTIYIDSPFVPKSTWASPNGWSYNDSYFALKHFSFYVRPGYIRYNATVDNANERVSVYQSADHGTTVIVAINLSATATDVLSLNLANVAYATSSVYRSTFSTPIATGERWANLGAYTDGELSMPPQSVATIVLKQ